jgi:CspA family cold shock protein
MIEGVVREWKDDESCGVVDSSETPGGCLVTFLVIETPGYKHLVAGQLVQFEYERTNQEGFAYRATVVVPPGGTSPAAGGVQPAEPNNAYGSSLTVTFDPPERPRDS